MAGVHKLAVKNAGR
jgi:hypothetical protein